jgi:hypothetical protein
MINGITYRNILLSIMKALEGVLPDGVNLVDETEEHLETSTVGVYPGPITWEPFEHGNRDDHDILSWFIGVYANTPRERDYIAITVYNQLKDWRIPVYDFENNQESLGFLRVSIPRVEPKRAPEEAIDKLRYFSIVSFQTIYRET